MQFLMLRSKFTDQRFLALVEGLIEHERWFSRMHYNLVLDRFEGPIKLRVGFSLEDHIELSVIMH